MTIDDMTSGYPGEWHHPKYNVPAEAMTNYVMRLRQRLGIERRHIFVRFMMILFVYNVGGMTRELVVSEVNEILKDEPEMRHEFMSRVLF